MAESRVRYLLDTNVFLERLLDQERSEEVGALLAQISSDRVVLTDFSFHSIGVVFHRLNRSTQFLQFVESIFVNSQVQLVVLEPRDMHRLVEVIHTYNLDFDDAYQYVAAEISNSTLISFDKDFDVTERGRLTPKDVLREQ